MNEAADPHDLARFLQAQEADYEQALAELRAGRKRSHWIWYVLPQLRGLGRSAMTHRYGIASAAEARAYLAHPVLGARLKQCVTTMNALQGCSAVEVLGEVDAAKFRSCLTLFDAVAPQEPLFAHALDVYFGGARDGQTLALLAASAGQGDRPLG
jgi:uncharacterized protein (DUF1810 family)